MSNSLAYSLDDLTRQTGLSRAEVRFFLRACGTRCAYRAAFSEKDVKRVQRMKVLLNKGLSLDEAHQKTREEQSAFREEPFRQDVALEGEDYILEGRPSLFASEGEASLSLPAHAPLGLKPQPERGIA